MGWTVTVVTDGHTRSLRESAPRPEPGVHRLIRYTEQLRDNQQEG